MDRRRGGGETAGLDRPGTEGRYPMRNRTRAIAVGLSLTASVLLLQGSVLGAATGNDRGGHAITFHVLFQPFNYTDLGAPGPSAADVIVFHDQLLQSGKTMGDDGSIQLQWRHTARESRDDHVLLRERTASPQGIGCYRWVWRIQDSPWRRHSR